MIRENIIIIVFTCLQCFTLNTHAQDNQPATFHPADLPVPDKYLGESSPSLPNRVLNHTKKVYPPLMNQELPTCGQAAGVYNVFGYEYNRLIDGDASDPNYQYPVSFTFNYLTGGFGWFGASAFDSWDMMKIAGHPSVEEFGVNEDTTGRIWMDGYDKYLSSMHRRVKSYYSLDVTKDENLSVLKHYLNDHLEGSEHGGVAMVYSNSSFLHTDGFLADSILAQPYDTVPMMEFLYGPPTHALTITGYVDTALFDFNDDGLSTDTIDINNDGVVDMDDNETGFWVISNTWGNYYPGISKSNGIFLIRYNGLSEIWDQRVFILEAEHAPTPKVTCKLDFEHPDRNHVNLKIGIASDTEAMYPEKTMDYPLVHFQGGPHNLPALVHQPGKEQLEMGLNLEPLLDSLDINGQARFFLIIENNGETTGRVNSCSFSHNTNTQNEYECRNTDISIPEKDTIQFSQVIYGLESTTNIKPFIIESKSTYDLFTMDSLSVQLQTQNATPPVKYQFANIREYTSETIERDIPMPTVAPVYENTWVPLEFDFPFGGRSWDSVCLYPEGRMFFDNVINDTEPYAWFPETAPATNFEIMAFNSVNKGSIDGKVYYQTHADSLFVHWVIRKVDNEFNTVKQTRITAVLNKTGEIYLQQYPDDAWNESLQVRTLNHTYLSDFLPVAKSSTKNTWHLTPTNEANSQSGISLSQDGLLSAQKNAPFVKHVYVRAADAENRSFVKRLKLRWAELEDARARLYPNPTQNDIHVDIVLEQAQDVDISIFDDRGRCVVKTSVWCERGITDIHTSKNSLNLSNGMYFCKLQSSEFNETLKLILF